MGPGPDAEGGGSATADSPKGKARVEGGELEHFQIGRPSPTEKGVKGPSLSV